MSAFGALAMMVFLVLFVMAAFALFGPAIMVFGERIKLWANEVCGFRERR